MTDNVLLDSHKLAYHPARIAAWLNGEEIWPLYVEIGPTSCCNYRCSFCALDYTGYKGDLFPLAAMRRLLADLAGCGVKSCMFAGAGEPLLHPEIAEIISHARMVGLDVAVNTNGSRLTPDVAAAILPHLSWIRVSFNAASPDQYAAVHACRPEMYERVLANLAAAVAVKRTRNLDVTIGVQSVILGDNLDGVVELAQRLKTVGVDYFTLKPFSRHPRGLNERLGDVPGELPDTVKGNLLALANSRFSVVIREQAIAAIAAGDKRYSGCPGLPFFACIEADGEVYPCHSYLGDSTCSYGNVIAKSFPTVWLGRQGKAVRERLGRKLGDSCRLACRLEMINQYLDRLRQPPPHVNFI